MAVTVQWIMGLFTCLYSICSIHYILIFLCRDGIQLSDIVEDNVSDDETVEGLELLRNMMQRGRRRVSVE